jgi:hypothetical protein
MENNRINDDLTLPTPEDSKASKAEDPRSTRTAQRDQHEDRNFQACTSKVNLADIQNAFPPEPSEERIIMEHIELTDPTTGQHEENWETTPDGSLMYKAHNGTLGLLNTGSPESSFLDQATALPPELVTAMQEEKIQQMLEEERKASLERSKSRKGNLSHQKGFYKKSPNTVEYELFELTNQLRPRQSGELDRKGDMDEEDSTSEEVDEEWRPLTQTQAFAVHAAGMFQHLAKKAVKHSLSFASKTAEGGTESDGDGSTLSRYSRNMSVQKQVNVAMQNMKEVERIIQRGRKSILGYAKTAFLFIVLPSTAVAFLLYYAFGNPGANIIFVENPNANVTQADSNVPSVSTDELIPFLSDSHSVGPIRIVSNDQPSYSWLVLFFGVRQVITFGFAVGLQHLVVAYYQQAGLNFTLVGPMARLLIIQAKVCGLSLVCFVVASTFRGI